MKKLGYKNLKKTEITREWTSRKKYKMFVELTKNWIYISEEYSFFDPTKELKNRYRKWVIEADGYIKRSINYVFSRIDFKNLFKKEGEWKYYIKFQKIWIKEHLKMYKMTKKNWIKKELYWEYKIKK